MTDRAYFHHGEWLLKTRARVDARVVCYSPDLTKEQRGQLDAHDIEHRHIMPEVFSAQMQLLKFAMLRWALTENRHATFMDWDTFIVKDWHAEVFALPLDLGITTRRLVMRTNCYRAWANGGVIFATSVSALSELERMVLSGGEGWHEYDEAFEQIESTKRSPKKQHSRATLRWWTDQIALSAVVRRTRKARRVSADRYTVDGLGCVTLFDCDRFNHINAEPGADTGLPYYIGHIKQRRKEERHGGAT